MLFGLKENEDILGIDFYVFLSAWGWLDLIMIS
jgi:hypothetical protein